MKKLALWISVVAFIISLAIIEAYLFGSDSTKRAIELFSVGLVALLPVAVTNLVLVLVKNRRKDDRTSKKGSEQETKKITNGGNLPSVQPVKRVDNPNDRNNQGGGNNPHYSQNRQN